MQAYLQQLQSNPLRTKMLTSGTLSGLQELLASWIAHDKNIHGHYFTSRVPKMALYGSFISAPMGHVLISILQRVFAGRTSLRAKIMQIVVSNLIVRLHTACHSRATYLTALLYLDLPDPKRGLPDLDGPNRRCTNLPPDSRNRSSRLYARHEGLVDHLSSCARLCASLPST